MTLINSLDVKGGQIVVNERNIGLLTEINAKIKRVFIGSEYINAVDAYSKQFINQSIIIQDMFTASFGATVFSDATDAVLTATRRNAIELLVGDSFSARVVQPVRTIINDSVLSGSGMTALRNELTAFVEGGQTMGIAERYIKQTAFDAFTVSDRAYTNAIAKENGVEFYQYLGGIIKPGRTSAGSRQFCKDRNEKYYHRKEIETWAGIDWAGKASGTNTETIFLLLGGYNCQHSIVPRSTLKVPKIVLQDAISKGYWTPTDFERKTLSL